MPVPAVSPYNWERTRIICHFVMGTSMRTVDGLSFQDKLETILDSMNGDMLESASDNVQTNNDTDNSYVVHPDFEDKIQPGEPYVVAADAEDRDEPHRPRVMTSVIVELEEVIKEEKPTVPAETLDFDDKLSVLLDIAERYYESVHCKASVFA